MSMSMWSSVRLTATGRKIKQILDRYPGNKSSLYITSSLRPASAGSHHQSGNAVDIGYHWYNNYNGGNALANWLRQFTPNLLELIHTPSNNFVKNGRRVGPYAAASHKDHIHVAMTSAQADRILRQIGAGGTATATTSGTSGSCLTSVRPVLNQQRGVNSRGYSPRLAEDGICGPLTLAGVRWLQGRLGVGVDGLWGPQTEAAFTRGSSSGGSSPSPAPVSSGGSRRIAEDGIEGPETISEMQRRLNVKR